MSDKIDFSKLAIKTIFPIDIGEAKFCHIELPILNEVEDYKKHCQNYSSYAVAKIPISKDEIVDMKLNVLKNGVTKYTMQYRNPSIDIRVRTDDAHGFPHMDIEEKGKPQIKLRLKNNPNDYEESIATILRYVEKNVNPLIGPRYWLMPQIMNTAGSEIFKLFEVYQKVYRLKTSFTDLARQISLEVNDMILSGKSLDFEEYQEIVNRHFGDCYTQEFKNGGNPVLLTNKPSVQGICLLPFPLIFPADIPFKISYIKDDYSLTNLDNMSIAGFVIETH